MAKLTSKQANKLANYFLTLAQAMGNYRVLNYQNLTKLQHKKLRETHKKTLDYSDDLFTMSAQLSMDDISDSFETLNAITTKIETSYQSLKDVQKAINISTQVVTLGASIFSLNTQAIASSLGNLKDAIKTDEEA
ncbi:hypothetical protein ACFFU1_01940 [Algibacter miyuki]|uniref:Methyl-accepting chemotaxis protein n=1 Tax=Algibacter miyuki TaxID=1306933 RepID=A0ABV5GVY6_9FLAO|nr:hypothetical protein [Algibacter miyuki]MDN3664974.1 hypothetical protein [Algibacter miyuki]